MKRRTFIKAAAAAALLPTTFFDLPKRAPIDLSLFSGQKDEFSRVPLHLPFEQSGMTYASDARICVRTSLIDAPDHGEELKFPNAAGLDWQGRDEWSPMRPERVKFSDSLCPVIGCNWGWIGKRRACDAVGCWEGMILKPGDEFSGDFSEECKRCYGGGEIGERRCTECKGGYVDYAYRLCGMTIAPRYVSRIQTLGDVQVSLGNPLANHREYTPVKFRFSGGEGLVMPMVQP